MMEAKVTQDLSADGSTVYGYFLEVQRGRYTSKFSGLSLEDLKAIKDAIEQAIS